MPVHTNQLRRAAVAAAFLGTPIEFYDFYINATAAATHHPGHFGGW